MALSLENWQAVNALWQKKEKNRGSERKVGKGKGISCSGCHFSTPVCFAVLCRHTIITPVGLGIK